MRVQGLKARPRRRGLPKDDGLRSVIADNILDCQFTAEAPNQRWIADFTYIWTAEGWLYVTVVIDLFSRRVVGWPMNDTMTAQLVTDALMMAIWRRGKPDALLHHSDRGSQYTSEQFQRLMADNGVTCAKLRRTGKSTRRTNVPLTPCSHHISPTPTAGVSNGSFSKSSVR